MYVVTIKFAHGIIEKLILDAKQYNKFTTFLTQPSGFFIAGDVMVNREFICVVEMKKK